MHFRPALIEYPVPRLVFLLFPSLSLFFSPFPTLVLLSFSLHTLPSVLSFPYIRLFSVTMGSVAPKNTFLFTSESVGEGHPDKMA